jgi:Tol biopolymer transport system component
MRRGVCGGVGLLAVVAAWVPCVAVATFPGANGKLLLSVSNGGSSHAFPGDPFDILTVLTVRNRRTHRDQRLMTCRAHYDYAAGVRGCSLSEGRFSPNGRRVAFAITTFAAGARRTRPAVINVDGTGYRELAVESAERAPVWGPGGKALLIFDASESSSEFTAAGLSVISLAGGDSKEVAVGNVASADWSSRGEIAFSRPVRQGGRFIDAMYVTRVGGGTRRLFDRPATAPSWSPNGARLAFISHAYTSNVLTASRTGRHLKRFKQRGVALDPVWSPDGRRILFIQDEGSALVSFPLGHGRRRVEALGDPGEGNGKVLYRG